jgi:GTP pyrophosphokinase
MENKTERPAEGSGSTAEQVARAIEYLVANAADSVTLTGEPLESHARGTVAILEGLRVDTPSLQAAALFLLPTLAMDNEKALEPAFGAEVVKLVHDVRQLLRIGAIAGLVSPTDASITRKNEAEARRAQVVAQDVARVRAGHSRRADPAGVAVAVAALVGADEALGAGGHGARDAGYLCAAR